MVQQVWMAIGLVFLAGCPYVGQGRVEDLDDDGVLAIRYGGSDCDDSDPEVGNCDGDLDGHLPAAFGGADCDDGDPAVNPDAVERCDDIDNDCDGLVDDEDDIAAELLTQWFPDEDGDEVGAETGVAQCTAPAGHVAVSGDCDDLDDEVFPGAVELCDEVDRDCDGDAFAGAQDIELFYEDADGDGYGNGAQFVAESCEPPADAVADDTDCDDADPDAFPANAPGDAQDLREVCDGADNDCNGLTDEDDPGLGPFGATAFFVDEDGDGFGSSSTGIFACSMPSGAVLNDGDCDDSDPFTNPDAIEVCGPGDEDCDGLEDADDDSLEVTVWYLDEDGDGVGQTGEFVVQCGQPSGSYALTPGDCNDSDSTLTTDGLFFADADGDGFGSGIVGVFEGCSPPGGFVSNNLDCDDTQITINPAGLELCNGLDDDCDGIVDDNPLGAGIFYEDADQDGFGADIVSTPCPDPAWDNWTQLPGDCADDDPARNPSQLEVCGVPGVDEDCNGVADADDPGALLQRFYIDDDGDGFGDPQFSQLACEAPPGLVENADDCNDGNPSRWAEQVELSGASGEPTLQEAVDQLCVGGTLLLDPDQVWQTALVIDRDVGIIPSDFATPVEMFPANANEPMFSVGPLAALSLQGMVLFGQATDRTAPAIELGSLALLDANSVGISQFQQVGSAFIAGELGSVQIRNSIIEDVQADAGLIGVDRVTAIIFDSTLADLVALPLPDGTEAALVRTDAVSSFELDDVTCIRCGEGGVAIRTRGGALGVAGASRIRNSAFLDAGSMLLDSPLAVDDVRFVASLPAVMGDAPFIATSGAGDLDLSNVGFQRTAHLDLEGSLTASSVVFRQVGTPGEDAIRFGLGTVLPSGLSSHEITFSLIVDPVGPLQVDGPVLFSRSRVVRPWDGGAWADGTGVFTLENSVVAAALTGVEASTPFAATHSAWLSSVDSGGTNSVGAQRMNLYVDSAEGLGLPLPPDPDYSMFSEGLPQSCSTCVEFSFAVGEQDFFTYEPSAPFDVDPVLWLPFFTIDSNNDHVNIGPGELLAEQDADGSLPDAGLNGGPVGQQAAFFDDLDGDGLRDGWDSLHIRLSLLHPVMPSDPSTPLSGYAYCLDLAAGQDCDQDGLDDLAEQEAGTWPSVADTDGDGILDGDEVPGRELLDD